MMDGFEERQAIIGGAHAKVKHDSAARHVTGEAIFIDDIVAPPGTLEAVFVTSPHAHAKINSIDKTKALNIDGVHDVLIAGDIPGRNDIAPVFEDQPILPEKFAQYVGHPVALVAADNYDVAFHAAKEVIVEYQVLKPILSIAEALEEKIPLAAGLIDL